MWRRGVRIGAASGVVLFIAGALPSPAAAIFFFVAMRYGVAFVGRRAIPERRP